MLDIEQWFRISECPSYCLKADSLQVRNQEAAFLGWRQNCLLTMKRLTQERAMYGHLEWRYWFALDFIGIVHLLTYYRSYLRPNDYTATFRIQWQLLPAWWSGFPRTATQRSLIRCELCVSVYGTSYRQIDLPSRGYLDFCVVRDSGKAVHARTWMSNMKNTFCF